MNTRSLTGIACGVAAGALWGLVFLAPELVRSFGPLYMTAGRYLCYGLISLALMLPQWATIVPRVSRTEWRKLCWLSLAGNTLYYLLLSSAVQKGGVAMTSLVIGFLPVAVTIIGSRDHGAVPLRKLAPSLMLCALGTLCIGWQALLVPDTRPIDMRITGLLCAFGALASWTAYAVGNARYLASTSHHTPHDWSLLTGIVTGAQSLLLIPAALLLERTQHSVREWLQFGAVSFSVAVLASIFGNALWNRMSRLLPLTLVGQMILFETLFALVYGFLWEQRLPVLLETIAFVLVVMSVLSCIAVHRRQDLQDIPHAGIS